MALPGVARLKIGLPVCWRQVSLFQVKRKDMVIRTMQAGIVPKELRISCLQRLGPHDAFCYGEWLHQRGIDAKKFEFLIWLWWREGSQSQKCLFMDVRPKIPDRSLYLE